MHKRVVMMGLLALAPCVAVLAQPYPQQPIRLVVSSPPGSTPDVGGRLIAQQLSRSLKQPVVVENKPGVNGLLAAREVLKQPADGYTLLIAPISTMSVNPHVYPRQAGDIPEKFVAVSQIYVGDYSLVTRAGRGLDSVQDVIAAARRAPGKLTAAYSSVANMSHVALELFMQQAGIDLYPVPFSGSPAAALAVGAGEADLLFETIASTEPVVATKRATRVAMTGPRRSWLAPDLPTVAESGLPDYAITIWGGLFAARGVPPERLRVLSSALADILRDDAYAKKLHAVGLQPGESDSAAFDRMWRAESALWRRTVAAAPALQQEK